MTVQPPGAPDFDSASSATQAQSTTILDTSAVLPFGNQLRVLNANINLPFYELAFDLSYSGAPALPWCRVDMIWLDQDSQQQVDEDIWWLAGPNGSDHLAGGGGRAKGNGVSLIITPFDTVESLSVHATLIASARQCERDTLETNQMGTVNGFAIPNFDPPAGLLGQSQVNLGALSTFTRLLPMWDGPAQFCVIPPAGQSTQVVVSDVGDQTALTSRVVWQQSGGAGAPVTFTTMLGRSHHTVAVTNTGGAAGNFGMVVKKVRNPA